MVRFGSFALHGPPPREEGGKHQGPEARPKVKEHWGGAPSPPVSPLQLERAASTSSLS